MPTPEFRFGMTLSASGDSRILSDVVRGVLRHVGLTGEAGERLLDQVMDVRRAAPAGDCRFGVTARVGEIEITLAQSGRDFKTSCPVPIR